MYRSFVIFFILPIVILSVKGCKSQCLLKGNWLIKEGRPTFDYRRDFYEYSHDKMSFLEDSVQLASGFFYNILDFDAEDSALGRYPFVFYGKKEKYKIVGDSLYLYNTPYKYWASFKINCLENGEVSLTGKELKFTLVKAHTENPQKRCGIRFISAHVYEIEGLYGVNYKVKYSSDDRLDYQQLSEKGDSTIRTFKLKSGTFWDICGGFAEIDLMKINRNYSSPLSEATFVDLEIGLDNGLVVKSHLENDDYPELLKLALVPVLYGHQKYVFTELPPVR